MTQIAQITICVICVIRGYPLIRTDQQSQIEKAP